MSGRSVRWAAVALALSLLVGVAPVDPVSASAIPPATIVAITNSSLNSSFTDDGAHTRWMTPDGRYVAFQSFAIDAAPQQTSDQLNVFVWDRQTSTVRAVTSLNAGSVLDGISDDGRFVLFHSAATNALPGITSGNVNLFQWDRETNVTVGLTNGNADTLAADGTAGDPTSGALPTGVMSPDARFVAFRSRATNLIAGQTTPANNLYLWDRSNGSTIAITANTQSGALMQPVAVSSDGGLVTFNSSSTQLVAGVTSGNVNVLTWRRSTGQITAQTTGTDGPTSAMAATPDGRFLVMQSTATDVIAGVDSGVQNILLHDRNTSVTTVVTDGNADSRLGRHVRPITPDGSHVLFDSLATNLGPSAGAGVRNVYQWTRASGATIGITNGGTSPSPSVATAAAMTPNGRYIIFNSNDQALPSASAGFSNPYLWDKDSGAYAPLGGGNEITTASDISDSGQYVSLTTAATNLIPAVTMSGQFNVATWNRNTLPSAPGWGSATAGPGQVTLTWMAPTSTGDSPVTSYVVTPFIGAAAQPSKTFASAAITQVVTGLTNGTTYTFRVAAINAGGTGPQSAFSATATPGAVPAAPTIGTATRGNTSATVTWTAPANNGGRPITGYKVTPYIGAAAQSVRTFASTATSQSVTGLTNGTTYTFKVAATNVLGTGAPSVASNAVTPAAVPGAPTIGAVSGGKAQAQVAWTVPASNGGLALTGYKVTPYRDGVAQPTVTLGLATNTTITGLSNGAGYRFQVAATSAAGTGAQSAASALVLPPFVSPTAFVTQQARDFLGRVPTSAETTAALTQLNGLTTPGAYIAALRDGPDGVENVDPLVRLYFAYFLRTPDRGGLDFWLRRRRADVRLYAISDQFAKSSEFKNRYGKLTNNAFVELVYQNVLGRPGDPGGIASWTGKLDTGIKTRGEVMVGFSESSEYKTNIAPSVDASVTWLSLLASRPDATSFNGWVATLTTGPSTDANMAAALMADPRYPARFP